MVSAEEDMLTLGHGQDGPLPRWSSTMVPSPPQWPHVYHDGPTLQTTAASVSFLPYLAKWHLRLLQQASNSRRHFIKNTMDYCAPLRNLKSSYG
ncbi:hypothetical protein E2C01_098690 [Portunus trituberculatus]|uniref:Uncharacterized protein n=1 Tax=Portunus trituberculatus TaxID=210409 RepID=A0A5B7JYF5_PORTR|nr:hypothetical protein [Portunus trituberculatus]